MVHLQLVVPPGRLASPHLLQRRLPLRTRTHLPSLSHYPQVWGDHFIFTYHIMVDMLYTVRITVPHMLESVQRCTFYDGPDAKMPKLSANEMYTKEKVYLASTFQVLYI